MKPSELLGRAQLVLFGICGIACALLSLLDLLGALHVQQIEHQLPRITLLMTSFILLEVLVQREKMDKLRELLLSIQVTNFDGIEKQIDKELERVFGDYIVHLIQNAVAAIRQRRVHLEGEVNLRPYYTKTLLVYRRSTFLATSIASESYYWKPGTYEDTFRQFRNNGGSMERIFIISGDSKTLTAEERRVISTHIDLGVAAFVVSDRLVPPDLKRWFVVESKGKIGWESLIDHNKEIRSSMASSDPQYTHQLLTTYRQLRAMAVTIEIQAQTMPK